MPTILILITTLLFVFSPLKTLLKFIVTSSLNHDPYKNYHGAIGVDVVLFLADREDDFTF